MTSETDVRANVVASPAAGDATGRQLVESPRSVTTVQAYNPVGQSGQYWASWFPATARERALLLRGFSEPDLATDEVLGIEYHLERVMFHPAESVDAKTGEVIPFTRTILFNSLGQTVAFGSEAIVRAISRIMSVVGRGPWVPPLVVVIRQVTTSAKRRTYSVDLIVVGDDQVGAKKRGK